MEAEAQTTLLPETQANIQKTPLKTSKRQAYVIIVLIVAVTFLLGTTIYFSYQTNILKQQISQFRTTPPSDLTSTINTPNPTPSSDTISDWIAYENGYFSFEIRYPSDWTIFSQSTKDSLPFQLRITPSSMADSIKLSQTSEEKPSMGNSIYPLFEINIAQDNFHNEVSKIQTLKNTPNMFLSTQLDTQIGVHYGKELNLVDNERNYAEKWFVFPKGNLIYSFRLVFTNPMDEEKTNQIVSTLKFLN